MPEGQLDFAQILEDLLSERENAPSSEEKASFAPSQPDESRLAWWVLKGLPESFIQVPRSRAHSAYPPPRKKTAPPPPPRSPERHIPLDRLSIEAIEAAKSLFSLAGLSCPDRLKPSELRRIYHRLAKTFHPDSSKGADGSRFRELAHLYGIVRAALKGAKI